MVLLNSDNKRLSRTGALGLKTCELSGDKSAFLTCEEANGLLLLLLNSDDRLIARYATHTQRHPDISGTGKPVWQSDVHLGQFIKARYFPNVFNR